MTCFDRPRTKERRHVETYRRVALARGSREPGQALTGAALSGVLLCEGHFPVASKPAPRFRIRAKTTDRLTKSRVAGVERGEPPEFPTPGARRSFLAARSRSLIVSLFGQRKNAHDLHPRPSPWRVENVVLTRDSVLPTFVSRECSSKGRASLRRSRRRRISARREPRPTRPPMLVRATNTVLNLLLGIGCQS